MNFPLTKRDISGYSPDQVDALMARVRAQYQNPERRLVTSAMLAVVKFDLVPGGYQIAAVDDAVAKVADTFDEREISRRVQVEGKSAIAGELTGILKIIRPILDRRPAESFDRARNGYSRRLVSQLLGKISVSRGEVVAPESHALRTMNLGRSRSGFERGQIDEFLALVIGAIHRQRTLR